MRIQAQHVKPGDRVRGIGITVTFSEPQSDFHTRLEGTVSTRVEEGLYATYDTFIVVPNNHLVNVRRSDENFRADRVDLIDGVRTSFTDDPEVTFDDFVARLTAVANLPRHREVTGEDVYELASVLTGEESSEEILDRLDAIAVPF